MSPRNRIVSGEGRVTNEHGFTLVEALIALMLSGVLAAALITLLVGQSRFYDRTDDQLNAEQVAQATFDLFSAEMRMAAAEDLLAAAADSVMFRMDLMQALVCDSTGADEATVYVFNRTTNTNLSGSWVGIALSGAYEEDFEYEDGWNPTVTASGSAPKADCVASGTPATGADNDYLRIPDWAARYSDGVPERGALMRAYGRTTYKFAPSTFFTTRIALWRGTQELVGPFADSAAFSYVMLDGSVRTAVGPASLDSVASVQLTATALGEGNNPHDISRDLDFEVPFRN